MKHPSRVGLGDSADHPVLAEPWTYRVVGVSAQFHHTSQPESWLELDLARDDGTVLLRFNGIHNLEIDAGFPYFYIGLEILDISHLQWDGLHI